MPNSPVGTAGGFAELRAQLLSRTGITGPARRRALARLTDGWLGELAQEAGVNVGGVALVAVGGYGRGELSPFSDLDLVLLHSTETPASYAGMLAERLWYPIWDSKIRLDHSVRSVGGARQVARTDLPAMLGMLDLRHIAGDPELAVTLHRRVLADWRADAKNPAAGAARVLPGAGGPVRGTGLRDHPRSQGIPRRAARPGGHAGGRGVLGRGLPAPGAGGGAVRAAGRARRGADLPAGPPTGCRCRTRTASRSCSAWTTGTCCCGTSSSIARTVGPRQRPDLAPRRPRAARPRRARSPTSAAGIARRIERTPLADGIVEQDGEAVLAARLNPATDPTLVLRAAAAAAQAGLPVSPATVLRLAEGLPAAARAVAADRARRVPGAARRRASR